MAGTRAGYEFHARVAGVHDAHVSSPAPGAVTVAIIDAEGQAPQELLDAVTAALGAETVRPVTDAVTVVAATRVEYDVTATLKVPAGGPDLGVVAAAAETAVRAYIGDLRIGRDIYRSALMAACHAPGVEGVTLTAPAADTVVNATSVAVLDDLALTTERLV